MPVWPIANNPASSASQVFRSRTKEMHKNPVRTIAIEGGTAGRQRLVSVTAAVRLLGNGSRENALPNSLKAILEMKSLVTTPAAQLDVADTKQTGLSEMIVGDAIAAEAANSKTTTAKVFSLPLNTFFSHSKNKKETRR